MSTHVLRYEIRIKGHLDSHWADWFERLTLACGEDGESVLTGPVPDQAALHGLLAKVRDLNLELIAVNRIEPQNFRPSRSRQDGGVLPGTS